MVDVAWATHVSCIKNMALDIRT